MGEPWDISSSSARKQRLGVSSTKLRSRRKLLPSFPTHTVNMQQMSDSTGTIKIGACNLSRKRPNPTSEDASRPKFRKVRPRIAYPVSCLRPTVSATDALSGGRYRTHELGSLYDWWRGCSGHSQLVFLESAYLSSVAVLMGLLTLAWPRPPAAHLCAALLRLSSNHFHTKSQEHTASPCVCCPHARFKSTRSFI